MDDELELHRSGKIRGSSFTVTCKQYTDMVEVGAQVPHEKQVGMKRVWSVEKGVEGGVSSGAKRVGMKRVASYQQVKEAAQKPCSSGGSGGSAKFI